MKDYEKKMADITVWILHDPSECYKCSTTLRITLEYNRMKENLSKKTKKMPRHDRSSPVRDMSSKLGKKCPNPTGVKRDICFKRPFEKVNDCSRTSPKKTKIEKKVNMKSSSPQSTKSLKKSYNKTGKKTKAKDDDKLMCEKKTNLRKEVDGSKTPGKGTLKRKRWYFNKLNNNNDNYEDDIFENEKFSHFQNLLEDETDSCEQYEGNETPSFPFSSSPRVASPTPPYKDCYSPTELINSRKDAEEYQHRMNNRKKEASRMKKKDNKPKNEKKKEIDVLKTLKGVSKFLSEHQHSLNKFHDSDKEEGSDDDDDDDDNDDDDDDDDDDLFLDKSATVVS